MLYGVAIRDLSPPHEIGSSNPACLAPGEPGVLGVSAGARDQVPKDGDDEHSAKESLSC
jgi:hypothetical protein